MTTNLVIGSEGFIGKPFCEFLESQGERVVHFDIYQDSKENDGRFAKFDLENVDKIYFLAWDVGGAKYLYDPKLQMYQLKWNLQLMTNVFGQIEVRKKPFLFVSSQLAEECDTVYGVTKRLGEVWTTLLKGVSVRAWNAYGVMEPQSIRSHVISDFIYQALLTEKIKMLTNGEERRQFIHVYDLARAFHLVLGKNKRTHSVYEATSYEWVKIKDVAKLICDLTGARLLPGKNKGHSLVECSNIGRVPGWLPTITLEEGLKRMVVQARELIRNDKSTK